MSLLALYLATRRVSPAEIWSSVGELSPLLVLVALALHVARVGAAMARWSVLTGDFGQGWWRRSGRNVLVGFALNNTLPARAGDAARIWMSRRQTGRDALFGAVLVVAEKVTDVIALAALALVGVMGGLDARVGLALGTVLLATLVIGIPVGVRLRGSSAQEVFPDDTGVEGVGRLRRSARSFVVGVRSLGSARILAALWWSLIVWILEGATYAVIATAGGLHVRPFLQCAVVGIGNLAGVVPALPGAWGTFELAVQQVLVRGGVAAGQAFAAGLLMHLFVFVPSTLAGALLAGPALFTSLRTEGE